MQLSKSFDSKKCWNLLLGVLGIYFSHLVTALLQEAMLKNKYTNDFTNQEESFPWASGFLIFPRGVTWIIGDIMNQFQLKTVDKTYIPSKRSAICAVTIVISTLTYTYAIYLTNFPVVMMFKSCNLISVILVGVLCSRVKDKKLKLGIKKIVVGVIITVGIIMFKVFDPESSSKEEKKVEILGIFLLIVSLLADGFLPDFQAEIKSEYKPLPTQMMTEINKWVSIISFLYSCILFEIVDIFRFLFTHKVFMLHMLIMSVLSTVGQMFVYRMIKQFKQHFAPFVITTRKIFTVGLSIIYFHHDTNFLQLLGLAVVFAMVIYEFVSELRSEKTKGTEIQHDQAIGSSLATEKSVEASSMQLQDRYQEKIIAQQRQQHDMGTVIESHKADK